MGEGLRARVGRARTVFVSSAAKTSPPMPVTASSVRTAPMRLTKFCVPQSRLKNHSWARYLSFLMPVAFSSSSAWALRSRSDSALLCMTCCARARPRRAALRNVPVGFAQGPSEATGADDGRWRFRTRSSSSNSSYSLAYSKLFWLPFWPVFLGRFEPIL